VQVGGPVGESDKLSEGVRPLRSTKKGSVADLLAVIAYCYVKCGIDWSSRVQQGSHVVM